jgi:uncharacterized protein YcbK (DUF882 family)
MMRRTLAALFGIALLVSSVTPALAEPPSSAQPTPPAQPKAAWVEKLSPVTFFDTKSGDSVDVRLYAEDGSLDEGALAKVDHLLLDDADKHLQPRLYQLIVKAAAHFKVTRVNVVSSWRDSAGKGSKHKSGFAMDFVLPGISASELAAHLRTYARVGVGIYTHPKTQFVHLDVREQSYHWLDASPPRRHWKEKGITDKQAGARDQAYTPDDDLPR